jgi:hypothetical protein
MVATHRSRGGDEIAVAVIPIRARHHLLQLDLVAAVVGERTAAEHIWTDENARPHS